jgi:hypothetical protein
VIQPIARLGLLVGLCAFSPARSQETSPAGIRFVEGAREAGLQFEQRCGSLDDKHYLIETIGSGVVLADFNGDGYLDVYLVNGGAVPLAPSEDVVNSLFLGDGQGHFRPGPTDDPARDSGFGVGAVAADYDRDGDLDLYVCNWGPNVLLRNRGDGTFEDVTREAGVGDPRWSTSAAFGDVDGDGLLDLYVANYYEFGSRASMETPTAIWAGLEVFPGPRGLMPEPDRLYRNLGDGTFQDVSESAGILAAPPGYSLAVAMADLDHDGRTDIYVGADSTRNFYWHNEGNGRFVDIGLEAGVALSGNALPQASMGIGVGDLKEDGLIDLVVTHFARDYNTYYEAVGKNAFLDATFSSGLAGPTFPNLCFGIEMEDLDADGHLDLFFANGHVYPNVDERAMATSYPQRNQIFLGRGDGTLEDVSARAGPGLELLAVSRGTASGDIDADGRIDVVVNNVDGPPHLLWNRTTGMGHWLGIRVQGRAGALDLSGVGAVVTVRAGDRIQRREVRAGTSYASASMGPLMFGLGDSDQVEELTVEHPIGGTRRLRNLQADRVLTLELGP